MLVPSGHAVAAHSAPSASHTSPRTRVKPADSLIVMLVGHGSYDGESYKLNLKGPDIEGAEFAELLAAVPARSQLVVNSTSASGAILETWGAEGRTLISVDWQGYVYDCDFNQMLGLPLRVQGKPRTRLADLIGRDLTGKPIVVADHCYGCTAGQGSSCGGALAA